MTTKTKVPELIRERVIARYGKFQPAAVTFPDRLDIYHMIYDLLEKRPSNVPVDHGNLEIFLPVRSVGKNTDIYNYLGLRSEYILSKKLEIMMWAELHDHLDDQKHRLGINYVVSVHSFMLKYAITGITEDAFLKNYYRWREDVRRKEKRKYQRKTAPSKCS